MHILSVLRGYLGLLVLIGLLWAAGHYLPRFMRETPDHAYDDMEGIDSYQSVTFDSTVAPRSYRPGDLVLYRTAAEGPGKICFAWVAARPGETVTVSGGALRVDGQDFTTAEAPKGLPAELAPVTIPEGHLWVVSSYHMFDSFVFGPIPRGLILGRTAGG